jgi:membrane associated rhomboid family serine protease
MIPISDENPVRLTPVVTWAILAGCVLAYLWEFSLGERLDAALIIWGFVPANFWGSEPMRPDAVPVYVTLVSSMFLHGGLLHMAGNMLYLWIFGNNIEDAMGHIKFTLFYLASGAGAALSMAVAEPASQVPMVGASGAISGVLGAYMLLYPRARVRVIIPLGIIFFPFQVRAVWVVGFWFITQLFMAALTPAGEPGVAWWAHVGGFAAGLVLTPVLKSSYVPYFGPIHPRGPWR